MRNGIWREWSPGPGTSSPSPPFCSVAGADDRILELYLEAVATKDNVDLLYHIAGKIKTVRDVSIPIPDPGSDSEEEIPENESKDARIERENREIIKRNKRVARANSVCFTLKTRLMTELVFSQWIDTVDYSK
jgi:hypothetical protein